MDGVLFLLLCTVGSVALGAALPWLPGLKKGALGPLRTFALAAALTVVISHLLPEAAEQIGARALIFFGIGLFTPVLVERAGHWFGRTASSRNEGMARWAAVHLGYLGLMVHQLTEGMALGAYRSRSAADVAVALAAHTVPLTALVMMGFSRSVGPVGVLVRAVGLAAASGTGILIGSVASPHAHDGAPWMTAIAAGLVLHLVGHDLQSDAPRTSLSRTLDLLALVAGAALTFVGIRAHHSLTGDDPMVQQRFVHALADLAMATAPVLLAGLALGALVQAVRGEIPSRWIRPENTLRQAFRGAVMGAPMPLCACGVLPLTRSLHQRGAGAAMVVAFLLSMPVLGIETFALTGRFLGWGFALIRLLAALALAVVTAVVVGLVRKRVPAPDVLADVAPLTPSHSHANEPSRESALHRYAGVFDETMLHTAPWVLAGLVAAAYVDTLFSAGDLAAMAGSGEDILVVTAIAIPSYVCASSATPLAAILIAKGFSPGAVLAGLLLGPITNPGAVTFLSRTYGKRSAAAGLLTLVAMTLLISFGVNSLLPASVGGASSSPISPGSPGSPGSPELPGALPWPVGADGHDHHPASIVMAVVLAGLVVRALWISGARAWVASLVGVHEHGHEDEHGGSRLAP